MIIYNPGSQQLIQERLELAEELLNQISAKYCFITGSFLYKEHYQDIDIFVVTRSKKEIKLSHPQAKVTILDFNDLSSLFYHALIKSCLATTFLPVKPLKVTLSDYWHIINEAIPTLLNQKNRYHKDIRFLILYTEYFKSGIILDTFQLDFKIKEFKIYQDILRYLEKNIPELMHKKMERSYLKRFFYTQAGYYADLQEYPAQRFLYDLTHRITRGISNG